MINKFLWAKKEEKNGLFKWLPLRQHLEDTKNIMNGLWEHFLSRGQKRFIVDSMIFENNGKSGEEVAKNLSIFLALTHDIGKCTPAFQTMRGYNNSKDLDDYLMERLESSGYKNLKNFDRVLANKSHHTIVGQSILSFFGVGEDVASIVGGHHGKPIDSVRLIETQKTSYGVNYFQVEDEESEVHKKWKKEQKKIFDWALDEAGFSGVEDIPKISQAGAFILSGLLIMADWIASNEEYFPLIDIESFEVDDMIGRFQKAWYKWYKNDCIEINNLESIEEIFKNRFGFDAPNDIQRGLVEAIDQSKDPGLIILEAPMGIGKTEAALVGAEELMYKTSRSGLFFGLPTQATSNGMFSRVEDWLENLSRELASNTSLRLVHSKAALNEDFTSLAKNIYQDSIEGSVITNEWFSGRKQTALDDFIVGTVDQFLLTALKQKHLALRHLGFTKKVVIIDEAHAYDSYMMTYLEQALRWMGAYRIPVVILSATLPINRRIKLIENYMRGRGLKWKEVKKPEEVKSTDYPLITFTDGDEIKFKNDFNISVDKEIKVVREEKENLINIISALYKNEGVIGVIMNTVKDSQDLAKECELHFGEDAVELLHSNFIATDRVKKENLLLSLVSKNSERPKRKIIIGTQVIEQSLDLDFDVMISELCPIDLLIQRVGRLQRHEIKRSDFYKSPTLYVIGTNYEFKYEEKSKAVYDEYILMRSQYFLPDSIMIPSDIPSLVNKVYEDGEVKLEDELLSLMKESGKKRDVKINNKEQRAKTYRLDKPDKNFKKTLVGLLETPVPIDSEEIGYARVRDIEDTIEVIALKKLSEGYGTFSEGLDLSKDIDNPSTAKIIARESLRLPLALSRYPKVFEDTIKELEEYNRKNLSDWQRQTWLRGSLGVIFDEDNSFVLNGYKLTYDEKFGLFYERVRDFGKIQFTK